jgi:hypothetical protein
MTTTTTIDARTVMTRLFEVIDGKRWDDYESVMQPDAVMISPFGTFPSPADWARFSRGFSGAVPDGRHHIAGILEEGDQLACWGTWNGTNLGPLPFPTGEVPATGRRVELPFCAVARVAEGRIAEIRVYLDQLTMLSQLGLAG